MASSILFDTPGPRTRARHRLYSVVFLLVLAGLLVWVFLKLREAGQLEAELFEELTQENIIRALRQGLVATLTAAALGIVGAVAVGLLLVVARLSDRSWVSRPAWAVTEFFRAVPLLLLIIFLFAFLAPRIDATDTRGLTALVLGLTLYNGAVLAEVFRAGINAVPKGQSEAAYAIGMRKSQVMRIVLIPQAVKFMLPAIISQCVIVLKDSSLGFVVVYPELLRQARSIAEFVDNQLMTYLVVAVIYIAVNSVLGLLATYAEKRASRNRGGAKAVEETEAALPLT